MYYQIEGRMNMKTLTFDEEGLTVGKQSYPIDDIENLKIASAPLFATYGILTFRSGGRDISVAFPRSAIDKLRRAMHDFEHEQMMRKKAAEKAAAQVSPVVKDTSTDSAQPVQDVPTQSVSACATAAEQPVTQPVRYMDPYEEVKKLKELLDMGIVTEAEFQKKKKELLQL
jgi:hypothetical protein